MFSYKFISALVKPSPANIFVAIFCITDSGINSGFSYAFATTSGVTSARLVSSTSEITSASSIIADAFPLVVIFLIVESLFAISSKPAESVADIRSFIFFLNFASYEVSAGNRYSVSIFLEEMPLSGIDSLNALTVRFNLILSACLINAVSFCVLA